MCMRACRVQPCATCVQVRLWAALCLLGAGRRGHRGHAGCGAHSTKQAEYQKVSVAKTAVLSCDVLPHTYVNTCTHTHTHRHRHTHRHTHEHEPIHMNIRTHTNTHTHHAAPLPHVPPCPPAGGEAALSATSTSLRGCWRGGASAFRARDRWRRRPGFGGPGLGSTGVCVHSCGSLLPPVPGPTLPDPHAALTLYLALSDITAYLTLCPARYRLALLLCQRAGPGDRTTRAPSDNHRPKPDPDPDPNPNPNFLTPTS